MRSDVLPLPRSGTSEAAPAAAAIEATDLYRFYHAGDEEVLALRGVSLVVPRGRIVAVAGPSGSGKSTLLAVLAGLDDPDGGTVRILGQRISRRPERDRSRLRRDLVGVLQQTTNLLPHLSVRDNVRLARSLPGRRAASSTSAALQRAAIEHRADSLPRQLSGGETARAGLAVAVANDPAVVLADEPTAELDTGNEQRLLQLLRELAQGGTSVVVATHSPAVLVWADVVVRLVDGAVVHHCSTTRAGS